MTVYDFRSADKARPGAVVVPELVNPWAVFQARTNLVHDEKGLHLWCRGGAGAGFMLKEPHAYGWWRTRCRISPSPAIPSTKVCLLLWEADGNWSRDHHEIDYNESGDRTRSNQTEHYGPDNSMHHSSYDVDQTTWHTYGVIVTEFNISYTCDGHTMATVPNESPGVLWSPHFRTQPHYDTESETVLDVRWIEVPDA